MIEKLENLSISKTTITRAFKVAVVLVVAGAAGSLAIVIWALANGAIALGGAQFVTVHAGPIAGAIVGLLVASLLAVLGTLAAVITWAGALLNTARLDDKAWFIALLVLGLISLGWVALIAYVLYGPDSTRPPAVLTA
jgi:hypothetical protein